MSVLSGLDPATEGEGQPAYDALLFVSFGGPEGPDDVMPFLENVTRGRGVPRDRLEQVATHYHARGGVSPINDQVRELIAAVQVELDKRGLALPVYWGNRNWHPMLTDTVEQMAADGVSRAIAFVTSAFSSYSGCRQYRENIAAACEAVGPTAPDVDKLRVFYDHPGFIDPMVESVRAAVGEIRDLIGTDSPDRQIRVLFTAHSIPLSMATGSDYQAQLGEASRLVAEGAGVDAADWSLVFQSRSGPPQMPWLEPDVCDAIKSLAADDTGVDGVDGVVVVPIGFVSDHMEVIQDLDTDAAAAAAECGLAFSRASTVGADPRFASMIVDLMLERSGAPRNALGVLDIKPDVCALDCCPAPQRPAARPGRPG